MDNPKSTKREQIIIVTVIVVVIATILGFAFRTLGSGNANTDFTKRYSEYNDNWTLTSKGEERSVIFPSQVHIPKGDHIVLTKVLPDDIPEYTSLAMRNYHQVMDVKVDGELIYTYPINPLDNFTILSDAWSIIPFDAQYAGKTLEITLSNITIRDFNGYISDMYMGDGNSVIQHLREDATPPFMIGVIMIILGLFLIGFSILYRRYTNQRANIAIAIAMMFFGVWLMNRSKIPYFSSSNGRIFFLSIMALLLVAPFLFLFNYYRDQKSKGFSRIGIVVSLGFVIFVIGTSATIRHNAELVAFIAYIMAFIAVVQDCVMLYRASFGKASKLRPTNEVTIDRVELLGTALFPLGVIIEVTVNHDMLWTEISMFFRLLLLLFCIVYVAVMIWRIYLITKERDLVKERLQESQLELMMGQIQPHFIFNTLSSIRTLVKTDPDVAYDMLYDFSKYLRANVDNVTNLEGIKFAAEVEHIKSYVNIENVRYGDRLNVIYDIGPNDFVVPPLSIQPLVENAIKHGVTKKIKGGTVVLKSYETDDYNIVEINDDGVGISSEAASRIFSIYEENDSKVGMESNQVVVDAMHDILEHLTLLDEGGEPIEIGGPTKRSKDDKPDTIHRSAGMMNIILRLREMSNATIEISSQVSVGTRIKVLFPKDKN